MWIAEKATNKYLNVFQRALKEPKIMGVFKQLSAFTSVVGVSEFMHGIHCYNQIDKDILDNIALYARNDSIGTPNTANTKHGRIGCDTLRFLESLSIIKKEFPNINSVIEFGSNYGGLAYCMHCYYPEIHYTMVDLPLVKQFSIQYLNQLGVVPRESEPWDLFVAEYSLTEFDDYEYYYDLYCKPLHNLFIRCNIVEPIKYNAFIRLLMVDFDIKIYKEPSYRSPNRIIIGHKKPQF